MRERFNIDREKLGQYLNGESELSDKQKKHIEGCEECQEYLSQTEVLIAGLRRLRLHKMPSAIKKTLMNRLVEEGLVESERNTLLERLFGWGAVGVGAGLAFILLHSLTWNVGGIYSFIFTAIPDFIKVLSKTLVFYDKFVPLLNAIVDITLELLFGVVTSNGYVFIMSGVIFILILLFQRKVSYVQTQLLR